MTVQLGYHFILFIHFRFFNSKDSEYLKKMKVLKLRRELFSRGKKCIFDLKTVISSHIKLNKGIIICSLVENMHRGDNKMVV